MVRRALLACYCMFAVTCGGGVPSASSRMVDRASLPAADAADSSTLLAGESPVRRVIPGIASVTGTAIHRLPNNGVPESTSSTVASTRPGWGSVIAAGSLLVVVVIAVITAAKRRKI